MSEDKPFKIWVVFKDTTYNYDVHKYPKQYSFDTEAELKAFKAGVEIANDWAEGILFDTEEEAETYIAESI